MTIEEAERRIHELEEQLATSQLLERASLVSFATWVKYIYLLVAGIEQWGADTGHIPAHVAGPWREAKDLIDRNNTCIAAICRKEPK